MGLYEGGGVDRQTLFRQNKSIKTPAHSHSLNHTFKQLCRTLVIKAWKVTCRIAKAKSKDHIQATNKRRPLFSCTFAAAVTNTSQRTSVAMLRADWAIR